jgi:hypothetical protein
MGRFLLCVYFTERERERERLHKQYPTLFNYNLPGLKKKGYFNSKDYYSR